MWIVAVAWIYVVGLMAVTEPNVVAAIMTFFLYCVFPLSILYYLTGSGRRRAQRDRADYRQRMARNAASDDREGGTGAAEAPKQGQVRTDKGAGSGSDDKGSGSDD